MKLEEVLPAFRAGKKIRHYDFTITSYAGFADAVENTLPLPALSSDNWSIVEEPATDEELAAAFEVVAEQLREHRRTPLSGSEALVAAADMVRKRCVDPSWKVGK